jgi:hypothetical protein
MGLLRIPTVEEFESYHGAHTPVLWAQAGAKWTCPGCGRSKFELSRWTRRTPHSLSPAGSKPFMGWTAALHRHHDHGTHFWDPDAGPPRFPITVICGQCNRADGAMKRALGLPREFSFSPDEIRRFVHATPHGPHRVDPAVAAAIYEEYSDLPVVTS